MRYLPSDPRSIGRRLFLLLGGLVLVFWFYEREIQSPEEKGYLSMSSQGESIHRSSAQQALSKTADKKQLDRTPAATSASSSAKEKTSDSSKGDKDQRLLAYLNSVSEKKRWKIQRDKDGRAYRALGGEIPDLSSSENVAGFVRGFVQETGVPEEQIDGEAKVKNGPRLTIYDFNQSVDGVPVYGASLRILTNQATQVGFMITNNLREVNETEIDPLGAIDAAQATALLNSSSQFEVVRIHEGPKKVVWAHSPPHQLAFEFLIDIPNDTLKVVIGAQSQAIIHSHSTVLH